MFPLQAGALNGCALAGRPVKTNVVSKQVSVLSADSGSPQSLTITATGPANTTTYSGTITGLDVVIPFSVLTDGSATATELASGILADIQGDPLSGVILASSSSAVGVVTVVAKSGVTLTVAYTANPGTVLATVTTAAIAAPQFLWGRAVEVTGVVLDESGIQVETVEAPDGSSVSANFAMVFDDLSDPVLDVVGESVRPVGPLSGRAMSVIKAGFGNQYAVEAPAAAPSYGGAVYVEGASGAENGRLYTAGGGSRVQWLAAKWIGLDPNNSAVAIIEI